MERCEGVGEVLASRVQVALSRRNRLMTQELLRQDDVPCVAVEVVSRLSLDEALAIALELQAVPAWMLTPPEGSSPEDDEGVYVKLTDDYFINGTGMREWLRSGLRSSQKPPTRDARSDAGRDRFQNNLALLALALVDAGRGKAGFSEAVQAIIDEVKRRELELANEPLAQ